MDAPITRKMALLFPVVGQIRKGAAKIKKSRPDGSAYETVGPDLGARFRMHFFPGSQGADEEFRKAYKVEGANDLLVERISATLTFRTVADSWACYNEAYQAGRLIAQADDEKFLRFIDPATGAVVVRDGSVIGPDGRPTGETKPYTPGESIRYERAGKTYVLKMKPYGRLRLWLPCFGRLVTVELRTTSFYDRLNVEGQLAAIEATAEALNQGNVAGIPLVIYRKIGAVLRPNENGSWARDEKYLINIEVDPAWVAVAMSRLRENAFGPGSVAALLPSGSDHPQVIEVASALQAEDGDEHDDVIEGDFEPEAQAHPPIDPPERIAPTPAPVRLPSPEIISLDYALTLRLPDGRWIRSLNANQLADELALRSELSSRGQRVNPMITRALNVVLDSLVQKGLK